MSHSVSLMAVGDIMLSGNRGTGAVIAARGSTFPFEKIRPVLQQADLRFGNLETPLSNRGAPSGKQDPHITFRASPAAAEGLRFCGFDVVSLANNHMNDYGEEALLDTVRILREHGIACAGAGGNAADAEREVVLERNGITMAFLAYSAFANLDTRGAGRRSAGISFFDRRRAARQVNRLRGTVDIIAVSMHWGLDFTEYPVPPQMKYARELIASGAHIVIGHHPHFLQGIEQYRHGVIAYSLGDFVFDEPGRETCVLKLDLSRRGIDGFDLIPARITESLQTEPVTGAEGEKIRERIDTLSSAYAVLDPVTARQMIDDWIWTNVTIFRQSGNLNALKSVCSPPILWRIIMLLSRKLWRSLRRGVVP